MLAAGAGLLPGATAAAAAALHVAAVPLPAGTADSEPQLGGAASGAERCLACRVVHVAPPAEVARLLPPSGAAAAVLADRAPRSWRGVMRGGCEAPE